MKRRDFLINSAATVGGCTLLSGCKKEELIKKEGQVVKRKFKDMEIPLLGFGCMRLPMDKDQIDMVELDKMVEYALNHGVNYFDTAFMYVNSKSEGAIGEILKKYKRESYFLADKAPIYKMRKKEDVRKIFNEQLKRCNVDYFDFYMAHNINVDTYEPYKNVELHKQLLELKKEGKVKYVGFSFHGNPEILKEVVKEGNWDFCQLQTNYFDWDVVKAKEQYEIVQEAKIPVIVMEPLRGGVLASLQGDTLEELKKAPSNSSPAEFGLRWSASLDNVITVLSGMSNLEQMKQNVATFENFTPITQEEKEAAKKITKIVQSQGAINCTACKYCTEVCPKGINIPAVFAVYNQYKVFKNKLTYTIYYKNLPEKEQASNCIQCGLCNKNCPQGLDIPKLLAEVNDEYEKVKLNEKNI